MKRLVAHLSIVLQRPSDKFIILQNTLTYSTHSPSHLQKPKLHGRNSLRRKASKPRHPRRNRTYDITRRLASGSANGDTRVLIRLVRTIGLLRWMRRRKEKGRRARRGRVTDGGRGRRRFDATKDYSARMIESIGRIMVENECGYKEPSRRLPDFYEGIIAWRWVG